MSHPATDITNRRFGKLVAVAPTLERSRQGAVIWVCECDCGKRTKRPSIKLVSGELQSCGCGERLRSTRTPPGQVGFKRLLNSYWHGAKARGLPFELSDEQIKELVLQNCTYCGQAPSGVRPGSKGRHEKHGRFVANGIDRLDSTIGYTVANCVPCCTQCNRAKSDLAQAAWLEWLTRIKENFTA